MAHEVVKKVGRRAYRYSVESYRDPATKKARSRWRYLGVAENGGLEDTAVRRPSPERARGDTRERLLDAFVAALDEEPYARVTAGAVATRAGLAHGTFYRHFRDKRAIFMAALTRVRETLDRDRPGFKAPYGDLASERARVRRWVEASLVKPDRYRGLARAFFEALEDDRELQALRADRRRQRFEAFADYIGALGALGITAPRDALAIATALTTLLEGISREVVASGQLPSAMVVGALDVFDRAIFSAAAGSCSATEIRSESLDSK